jgi:hypothetical protein
VLDVSYFYCFKKEDLLLISGGDVFEGEMLFVWSMKIRRGDNGISPVVV